MVWIAAATIGSAAIGGYSANQSRKAQDRATAASQQGFNQYKPYVDANLAGSNMALEGVIDKGAYTGDTYAGPNDFQTGTANTMGTYGTNMMGAGNTMMSDNSGFGGNSRGMYDQFQGMSEAAKADRLAKASSYATENSAGLVDAAMRDDRRNLQENVLTGIDMNASATGNMNSSRAGVAEAVAQRGFDDRRADVAMDVQDRLMDRSLNQQAQQFSDQGTALNAAMGANTGINNAYNTGMNTLGEGANFGMNAGNSLQGFSQAGMDDKKKRFEDERDFELNQRKGFQSGVLGKSPNSPSVNATTASPVAGALSGAMTGFGFMKEYGDQFNQPQPSVSAPMLSQRPRMRPGGFS